MPAKYVVTEKNTRSKEASFHWNLVATNGRVIASSETYDTRRAALAGIASVQKNAATTVIVDAATAIAARPAARVTASKNATAAARPKAASSAAAAKVRATPRKAAGASEKTPTTAQVRAWALSNGHQVSPRGRISSEVTAAYRQAH